MQFRNFFIKIGQGILVTHSQSGGPGWITAIKNPNVSAVISYEPGSNNVEIADLMSRFLKEKRLD